MIEIVGSLSEVLILMTCFCLASSRYLLTWYDRTCFEHGDFVARSASIGCKWFTTTNLTASSIEYLFLDFFWEAVEVSELIIWISGSTYVSSKAFVMRLIFRPVLSSLRTLSPDCFGDFNSPTSILTSTAPPPWIKSTTCKVAFEKNECKIIFSRTRYCSAVGEFSYPGIKCKKSGFFMWQSTCTQTKIRRKMVPS